MGEHHLNISRIVGWDGNCYSGQWDLDPSQESCEVWSLRCPPAQVIVFPLGARLHLLHVDGYLRLRGELQVAPSREEGG